MRKPFKQFLGQNVLSILFYKGGFSFLLYENEKIKEVGNIPLHAPLQEEGDKFIETFSQHHISKFDTECVELSYLNNEFTFIPQNEFYSDSAQLYLESVEQINPFSSIRFNPIPSKNNVVCFAYNEDVEFFFEKNYPFVNVIHNSKRVLDKLPNELKNTIQLIFSEKYFEIVSTEEQLQYYNCVEYHTYEDILYAVQNYLFGANLDSHKYQIALFGRLNIPDLDAKLNSDLQIECLPIKDSEWYSMIS